jgi:hypothetical protein
LIDDIVRKQALYTEHVGADVDENGTSTPRRRIGRGVASSGRTLRGESGGAAATATATAARRIGFDRASLR